MRMYTDLCTVKRYMDIEEDYETRRELVTIYENVPCRISQKALGSNNQTDSTNRISYESKLFLSSNFEIRQGDTLEVSRTHWMKHIYKAGEPFGYHNHQEIILEQKRNA